MFRAYLKEEIQSWSQEMAMAVEENDQAYIAEINETIAEIKAKDRPYDHIIIENEITINTLRKIVRNMPFNLDRFAEMEQPLENLDNGFITPEYLKAVIQGVFNLKANGKYPNSTLSMFGHKGKADFVKSKLEELLQ